MGVVGKVIAVVAFLALITAFDYFVDLPSWWSGPEMFQCVTQPEMASGQRKHGFMFCP